MAQVKVTSYYSRRKRIDDAQPTKRRKILPSVTEEETADSSTDQADLKAGLQRFRKQLLPQVDRAVLVENTIAQCTKSVSVTSTARTRSTRKPRASTAKSSKKTKKGPLDKHLERVNQNLVSTSDSSDSVQNSEISTHRSPPSTPTKRPQHSDEAPCRKKRSRFGSADVVLETDEPSWLFGKESEQSGTSRRKVQAGRHPSRGAAGDRSAKKSLEASLLEFGSSKELDTKDNILSKDVSTSQQCHGHDAEGIAPNRHTSSPSRTAKTNSTTTPSSKHSVTIKKTSDSNPVSQDNGMLQAFIERTTRSVASSSAKGSKVNTVLSNRIREAVKDVQSSPSKASELHESSTKDERKNKLTPSEMRERLSKSCKLSDLQARLARVKECADQARDRQKAAADVSGTSKPDTAAPSASKIDEPAMPAYQKYHSLVKSAPPTLGLPFKYKLLEEMFRSTDTVVSMLHNRSETCSFPKLKQAVQEMCRRTFEHRSLGQIKTVYPTAYFLRQQKTGRTGVSEGSTNSYELVLEANIGSGIGTSAGQESSEPVQPVQSGSKNTAMSKLISKFTPSMLIARRTIFHNNLVDIVREHHNEFLSKLDRPLSVPSDKLARWHPKFPLDQIPDIQPSALPQPPAVTTYNTAKDVLDKARIMMNPRVAKALEVVAKNSALLKAEKERLKPDQKASTKQEAKDARRAKAVSSVNQSLLDRIRAKEAQNVTAMMTRSPAAQERIAMLERLPELCRILRVFFVAEKKAALPLEAVIQKLTESYPSVLSKAQVEKHVGLMVEVLPEWLSKVTVRKDDYLKMNKTKDMSQVNERVKQLLMDSKQVKGQS